MPIRDLSGSGSAGPISIYATGAKKKAAPPKKKDDGGILGVLKDIGGTTLKALTVPGAVVTTGVNYATGGDVDVADLGGAFTNKDGRGAGFKLMKRFGMSDTAARWAGLAPEILLDPTTYLSGGLSAVAKGTARGAQIAKFATRAEGLAELANLEKAAKTIAGPGAKKLLVGAGGVEKAGLSPKKVAELRAITHKANAVRRELETMGGVPALRLGVGRKTIQVGDTAVKVPRGLEVKLSRFNRFAKDPAKGGPFRQSPLAKEFQRNKRAADALDAIGGAVQQAALKQHNITDEELHYIGNYLALKATPAGDKVRATGITGAKLAADERQRLIDIGKWRPEMDAVAKVYSQIDDESAKVLGLATYADQVEAFSQVLGNASAKVAKAEEDKAAEIALAKREALTARFQAAEAARPAAEAKVQRLELALAEIETTIASSTAPSVLKKLRAKRSDLRRQVRKARAAVTDPPKAASVERRRLADTIAKIETKYNPDTIYAQAATEFAEHAKANGYASTWKIKRKGAPPGVAELEQVAAKLATVDGHFTVGAAPEMRDAVAKWRAAQLAEHGLSEPRLKMAFDARGIPDVRMPKKFVSPTLWTTQERYIERLVKDGVPEDVAIRTANLWHQLGQKFAKEGDDFWSKTTIQNLPDVDFFRTQRQGQYTVAMDALEKHTEHMIKEAFPDLDDPKVLDAMMRDIAGKWEDVAAELPTSIRRLFVAKRGPAAGESRFAIATTWLKLFYTNFNPIGHYTLNATGSFLNSLVQGNRYHFSRGLLGAFGFATRKLGKMDPKAMEKVYKVGDGEMTGLETLVLSAISGLGAPYSHAEISKVLHLVNDTEQGKVRWLAKHLNNFQMNRENADRMYAFLNHVRGGDDIFTAGSKVVRYAFDYDQLTAFEKVWMRNLFLFYTWFRKNLTFQGYGVLTRPGIYSTMADLEASRKKNPGEPEWWAKAGGVGTPLGLLTFGNPYADVFKYSADLGDARRTVVSSLNPFIKLPLELSMDRDAFTGAPIGTSGDGGFVAGLQHVRKAAAGPQGKLVESAFGTKLKPGQSQLVDVLGRFSGVKIQQHDHEGNARRYAQETAPPKKPRDKVAAKRGARTRTARQLARYRAAGGGS